MNIDDLCEVSGEEFGLPVAIEMLRGGYARESILQYNELELRCNDGSHLWIVYHDGDLVDCLNLSGFKSAHSFLRYLGELNEWLNDEKVTRPG